MQFIIKAELFDVCTSTLMLIYVRCQLNAGAIWDILKMYVICKMHRDTRDKADM